MADKRELIDMTRNAEVTEILHLLANDPVYAGVRRRPIVSIPQVALAIIALSLFAESTYAYIRGELPVWAAMTCNLIAAYLASTTLLAASHRAVSSNAFLNDLIGLVTGQLLLPGVNMTAFRAIHLDDRRFSGRAGRAPDTTFVDSSRFFGIIYLLFAEVHWVLGLFCYGRQRWSRKLSAHSALLLLMVAGIHVAFLMSPWWKEFLLLYVVPQRLWLGWVAHTFAHAVAPAAWTTIDLDRENVCSWLDYEEIRANRNGKTIPYL